MKILHSIKHFTAENLILKGVDFIMSKNHKKDLGIDFEDLL